MLVHIYDLEVYRNFFSNSAIDYKTKERFVFEISERRNDLDAIVEWANSVKYLIGFNNVHYDDIILMFIVKNHRKLKNLDYTEICKLLKELSDMIIMDDDGTNHRKYSSYKYNKPFISIDLFLYWSKLTRKSRKLSLKSLAINMNWPIIQELPIPPDALIKLEDIDNILKYNMNDVGVTEMLADKKAQDIGLRKAANLRYGFQCLSWDGVKLGLNIIVKRYCDRTGKDMKEVNQLRTHREVIDIGKLIFPCISFKEGDSSYVQSIEDKHLVTKFKSFYGLLEYLKKLSVTNTNQISCQVLLNGNRYDVKSGGLHTYHNAQLVTPGEDDCYRDKDVSSYYPSLGAEWRESGTVPEHLGVELGEELGSMTDERLELKARGLGKGNEAELAKLALNGGYYGNTNNMYTPMFDPQAMLTITINGQLFLLMLCERLMEIGVRIDMCNTDGITIIYNKSLHNQVEEICNEWEKVARVKLETVEYLKVVRMNINNYMAIYKEKDEIKVKEKGMFLTEPPIDQSRDYLVIPKALVAYFKDGTSVETFIREHSNIYDFCAAQKVDKKYRVFWNGKEQQRLNRYYVSNGGPYLYKCKAGTDKMDHMMKGWSVQIFNNYEELPMGQYNINYDYYISEAKKLINELEPQQATLFK